jgi:hypothetical protein
VKVRPELERAIDELGANDRASGILTLVAQGDERIRRALAPAIIPPSITSSAPVM